jgi:hypothetical protein
MTRLMLLILAALLALVAPAAAINFLQDYDPSTKAGDPAWFAFAVTPSDSADLAEYCTALWVGSAGNVAVVMAGQEIPGMTAAAANAVSVTFAGVNAGQWLPIRIGRVMATNTTATSSLVCVYR